MNRALRQMVWAVVLCCCSCCPSFRTMGGDHNRWTPEAVRVFADSLDSGDCIPYAALGELEIRLGVPEFEVSAKYVRWLLYIKANDLEISGSSPRRTVFWVEEGCKDGALS